MSRGNEGRLIDKIHRQTDKYKNKDMTNTIFRQKMNMAPGSTSGTPDVYYEGSKNDLWIEYKVIEKWQGKRVIPMSKVTALQMNWLLRRTRNNQTCAVIIGDLSGTCMIIKGLHLSDPGPIHLQSLYTPKEVAKWIYEKTA